MLDSCVFPHPFSSVLVKYSGYLEHMDKPFDSNCFRKTPRLMKLGEGKFRLGAGNNGIAWGQMKRNAFGLEICTEHRLCLGLVFLRLGFGESAMCSPTFPHETQVCLARLNLLPDLPAEKFLFVCGLSIY